MALEVKNLLPKQEMQETQVQPLGWEDTLEEEVAPHSRGSFLENFLGRGAWPAIVGND